MQVTSLHVLCDILTTHPTLLSQTTNPDSSVELHPLAKAATKVFTKALKAETVPEVQTAAVVSLCKLLLTRALVDPDLLKHLVTLFFNPASRSNVAVRQALSYFLPAFAYSRRENMELLASTVSGVMHSVVSFQDDIEEDEEAVSAVTVGTMLAEWTDVRKLVSLDQAPSYDSTGASASTILSNGDIHANLAITLLERIQASACTKDERKALVLILGKLYINSNSDPSKLQAVKDAAEEISSGRLISDAASRNSLAKLITTVEKALAIHSEAKDDRNTKKRNSSKAASGEDDEETQTGIDSEKIESDTKIAVKSELSLSIDEHSIMESRIDDDGDTIMES